VKSSDVYGANKQRTADCRV